MISLNFCFVLLELINTCHPWVLLNTAFSKFFFKWKSWNINELMILHVWFWHLNGGIQISSHTHTHAHTFNQ